MKSRTPYYRSGKSCQKRALDIGNRRGLTMMETMVALVILALGIVGVLQAFSASLLSTKEAEMYSQATVLANQVASQLEREGVSDAGKHSGVFEDAEGFSWEANVEPEDSNGLIRSEIAVLWGSEARQRRLSMVCYVNPQQESGEQSGGTDSSGGRRNE